jgi:ADP-ribosylglycohydrolase
LKEKQLSRAMAVFYGNALGDSLGAHTEFEKLSLKRKKLLTGWDDLKYSNRCQLGVVTDDCSMARCLADSILVN